MSRSALRVVQASSQPVPLEAIHAVLTPLRANDLRAIFSVTPPRLRPVMALAFAELSQPTWEQVAGFDHPTVWRWLTRVHRMPFGAAVRLARVSGVPAEELFEDWL